MTPIDPTTIIPKSLKFYLANTTAPWCISPDLFDRAQKESWVESAEGKMLYKKCEILPTDPEHNFILQYFMHQKPSRYSIAKAYCIHTPSLTGVFEGQLEIIDKEAEIFRPEWENEDLPDQRGLVIERWKEQVHGFYPISVKQITRCDPLLNVRMLPLWHGTTPTVCHSIAMSGFTYFGKHHFFNSDAKSGTFKNTDPGYFGSGIYFTNSAKYASIYNSGTLLLAWVSMREPFPIINNAPHPKKGKDMGLLEGGPAYQSYNAHYIPVAPISSSVKCTQYYPCYQNQAPACDEIVVFQKAQTLPRFWIELAPDLTTTPSIVPFPVLSFNQAFLQKIYTQIAEKNFLEAWKNFFLFSTNLTPSASSQIVRETFILAKLLMPSLEKEILLKQVIPILNLFPTYTQEQADFARLLARYFLSHKERLPALFYFSQALTITPDDEILHAEAFNIFIQIIEESIPDYISTIEKTSTAAEFETYLKSLLHLKTSFCSTEKTLEPCFTKARDLLHKFPHQSTFVIEGLTPLSAPPVPRTKIYFATIKEWQNLLASLKVEPTPQSVRAFQDQAHSALETLFNDIFFQDTSALLLKPLSPMSLSKLIAPHASIQITPCPALLQLQLAILGNSPPGFPSLIAASSESSLSFIFLKSTPSQKPQILLKQKQDLFQALLASEPTSPDILLESLNALLSILASCYALQETNPLDQIQTLPLDPISKSLLTESYVTLYAYLYHTPSDPLVLKEFYWLSIRPLFYSVRKAVHEAPLRLPSLFETAIHEIWWSEEPEAFTSIIDLLVGYLIQINAPKSLHQQLYTKLSSKNSLEFLRVNYIAILKAKEQDSIIQSLISIPNRSGYRYEETMHMEALFASIAKVIQKTPPHQGTKVCLYLAGENEPYYLKQELIAELLDVNGDIQAYYAGTVHNVCPLGNLHFKQKPFQPLMEYAAYTFAARVVGVCTPPTILAKIQIDDKKTYPVLISHTVHGKNLREILKNKPNYTPENTYFTWQVLLDLLLRPGDKKANNHIVNFANQIVCVDNDISFVEPLMKEGISKTVNFCSILFSLKPMPLDPSVYQTFCSLNADLILESWLQSLLLQEKIYQALFSQDEINALYNEDKDNRFTPTLLLPAGAITTLYTQFLLLQQFLSENKDRDLVPTDLLECLITLKGRSLEENRIGPYLKRYYQEAQGVHPEEKLKNATQRDVAKSIVSSRALGITVGTIPTSQEVHQKKIYSLEKACEEFIAYSLIRGVNHIKVAILDGNQNLTVDFSSIYKKGDSCLEDNATNSTVIKFTADFIKEMLQKGQPDIERQDIMLKGLHALISLQKLQPTAVHLINCAALSPRALKPFLHAKLRKLDLRGSSIPFLPPEIEILSPNLEELNLRSCLELEYLENRGWFSATPLNLPHLKILNVSRCPKLASVQVNSSCIIELKANHNPQLKIVKVPFLVPNTTRSPRAITSAHFLPYGKQVWANYFGEIGEEPPLPTNLIQLLNSPCPIWANKQTCQTHLLVLIPATINGKPFTLKLLRELIKKPNVGLKTTYRSFCLGEYQDQPVSQSYWILMTRKILEGSSGKEYEAQIAQIQGLTQKTGTLYGPPRIIEAATCILIHHVATGQRFYRDSMWTRCEEFYDQQRKWTLAVVGSCPPLDINIDCYERLINQTAEGRLLAVWEAFDDFNIDQLGIVAVRKF